METMAQVPLLHLESLYVILDVYSRFVVGWMVAHRWRPHVSNDNPCSEAQFKGSSTDLLARPLPLNRHARASAATR